MLAYYWPLHLPFLLIYFFMTSGKIVSGNPRGFTQSGARTNVATIPTMDIILSSFGEAGDAKYLGYSTEVDLY